MRVSGTPPLTALNSSARGVSPPPKTALKRSMAASALDASAKRGSPLRKMSPSPPKTIPSPALNSPASRPWLWLWPWPWPGDKSSHARGEPCAVPACWSARAARAGGSRRTVRRPGTSAPRGGGGSSHAWVCSRSSISRCSSSVSVLCEARSRSSATRRRRRSEHTGWRACRVDTCGATVRGAHGTPRLARVPMVPLRGKLPCAPGAHGTQEAGTRSPYLRHGGSGTCQHRWRQTRASAAACKRAAGRSGAACAPPPAQRPAAYVHRS